MITNNWGRILLPIAFSIGAVLAVDPSSAEKAKWDAKCKASEFKLRELVNFADRNRIWSYILSVTPMTWGSC